MAHQRIFSSTVIKRAAIVTLRKGLRWGLRATKAFLLLAVGIALLMGLWLGYGISSKDTDRLEAFCHAASDWQHNPDFRRVGYEYVRDSYSALQVQAAGVSASDVVIAVRSLPGMPVNLAMNPGSRRHYADFSSGELNAYLHLCSEQGTAGVLGNFQQLGQQATAGTLSDAQIKQFLTSFDLPMHTAQDAGAIKSVRQLLRDTHAEQGFNSDSSFDTAVEPYVAQIINEHGWSNNSAHLTAPQQAVVLDELDGRLKAAAPPLWRLKQVTDFLNGIWGQGYSQIYRSFLVVLLWLHTIGQITSPVGFAAIGFWFFRRRAARDAALLTPPEPATA